MAEDGSSSSSGAVKASSGSGLKIKISKPVKSSKPELASVSASASASASVSASASSSKDASSASLAAAKGTAAGAKQKKKGTKKKKKKKVNTHMRRRKKRNFHPRMMPYNNGNREDEPVFDKDLVEIMYGFGDNAEVDPRTVELLDQISKECMAGLLRKAVLVGGARGKLDHDCFLYTLRNRPRLYARAEELLEAHKDINSAVHQNLKREASGADT